MENYNIPKTLIDEWVLNSESYIIIPKKLLNIANKTGTEDSTNIVLTSEPELDKLSMTTPNLHQQIRQLRKKYKIKQQELANQAKMKQSDISCFEGQKRKHFSTERIDRIILALRNVINSKRI